jgi:outer membrane protein OmpA-like peptidoglycan-associated protein
MLHRLSTILIFIFIYLLFPYAGKAQELNIKMQQSVYLSSVRGKPVASRSLHFPNIGKIKFYQNPALVNQILLIESKPHKNYALLDSLLTEYTHNFGIDNFKDKQQLDFIWRLGQVKEILRDTTAALFYYALALNHQPKDSARIRLHYDALQTNKKVNYVDRNFYYKMLRERTGVDTLKLLQDSALTALGKIINSPYPDYAPVMHPSNQILIFTSRRNDYNPTTLVDYKQNEDLYYTELTEEGWTDVIPFPPAINTRYNEGSACLNREGNILYFVRCNHPEGLGNCDIYSAELINKEWKNVYNLGAAVNSSAWDSHPALSPDGKTLYFASNRSSGFGGTDLYKTTRRDDGTWTLAKNLGPILNTAQDEVSPFIHPLNNTLYFSSKGHLNNYGGFDIYRTKLYAGNWEPPRNLGPLINTAKDEYYFSIDARADTLFYARTMSDHEQNMDIFSYPMPMTARPDAIVNFSGYLIDSASGQPITGIITIIDLDKNTEVEPIFIQPDGFFEFHLINNRTYQLQIQGHNALHIQDEETLPADSVLLLIDNGVRKNIPIIFESLEFMENKTELTLGIELQIDYIIDYLSKRPDLKLEINVHTDSDGNPDYNLSLSKGRAESIRQYILKQTSYPPSRIIANGLGDSRPIFPNDSPENKARNRRVEFLLSAPSSDEKIATESKAPTQEGNESDVASSEAVGSGQANATNTIEENNKKNKANPELDTSFNSTATTAEANPKTEEPKVSPQPLKKYQTVAKVEKLVTLPVPARELIFENLEITPLPKPSGWPSVDSLLSKKKQAELEDEDNEEATAKEIESALGIKNSTKSKEISGEEPDAQAPEDLPFEEEEILGGEDLEALEPENENEEKENTLSENELEEAANEENAEQDALDLIESSIPVESSSSETEEELSEEEIEENDWENEDDFELDMDDWEENEEEVDSDLEGLDIEGLEEEGKTSEDDEMDDIDDMEADDLDAEDESAPAWDDDFDH